MLDTIFQISDDIQTKPMGPKETQWWLDQALNEVTEPDKYEQSIGGFMEFIRKATEDGFVSKCPPTVHLMNDLLERMAPEDMKFSVPTLAVVCSRGTKPAEITLLAWSLVIETLRHGRAVTLRDLRHGFSPKRCISDQGLAKLWELQKIPRDPITRSDSWLDKAEAWTLEGLAKKNSEIVA